MRTQTRAFPHPTLLTNSLALMLGVTLPLAAQTPAPGGPEMNAAFVRLDKTAQQFKAVTADIQRDVFEAVINDHEKDMGTIKARREKSHETRMLIDLTSPDAKTALVDETTVSVYYPKIKTVQVYDIGARRGLVDKFLLLGFGASSAELKEQYDITWVGMEKLGTENTWHLQLIPKSSEVLQRLKKAELWVSETTGLPAQQRFVTSTTGDFMLVTYTNVKLNPPLGDGALKLNYPKGVTVEHPRL
jgi:outer membrane lipoprotein-sorting protein